MNAPLLNLMVALGVGLLVGVERERTKLEAGNTSAAGVRTFSVASLAGAVALMTGGVTLLAVVTAGVVALTALGYWRTYRAETGGLTTEFALVLTVLMGALAVVQPAAAAGVAVVTALLLAARERLHHFAGSVLTDDEMRSALVLGAAAVVVLPLLPNEPMGPFDALVPYKIWRLVVLVLMIGAAGHVATRLLGPRFGLPISGLASGFVSSSATIGAMGVRAAKAPEMLTAAVAGAVLSTVATVVQMAVVVGAASGPTLAAMAPPLVAAGVTAVAYGAIFTRRALSQTGEPEEQAGNAFSLVAALVFAGTLAIVMLFSAALKTWYGEAGAIIAAALAGFVDTHASAISIASLVAQNRMTPDQAVVPILAGFTTNSITKVVVAMTAGGRDFAILVAPGVLLVAGAAWLGALARFAFS